MRREGRPPMGYNFRSLEGGQLGPHLEAEALQVRRWLWLLRGPSLEANTCPTYVPRPPSGAQLWKPGSQPPNGMLRVSRGCLGDGAAENGAQAPRLGVVLPQEPAGDGELCKEPHGPRQPTAHSQVWGGDTPLRAHCEACCT